MKLLITGANGQLGTEIARQLAAGGSALGSLPAALVGAEAIFIDLEDGDLSSQNTVDALFAKHQPDVVVNCAAYTNVDGCETHWDTAFAANALAPRNLAIACETTGAALVHISTDYVFSGQGSRPFTEADPPAPNSAYGRSKLQGEAYVRAFCSRWFIVRTAWLYGRHGKNFVKTICRVAKEKGAVTVVNDQLGNPTNAEDLAHHLLQLLPTRHYGLYHGTGGGICSWYQFAAEIVRLAGINATVTPCTSAEYAQNNPAAAWRPAYSALDHTMLRLTVGDHMRPWQNALADYFTKERDTP